MYFGAPVLVATADDVVLVVVVVAAAVVVAEAVPGKHYSSMKSRKSRFLLSIEHSLFTCE